MLFHNCPALRSRTFVPPPVPGRCRRRRRRRDAARTRAARAACQDADRHAQPLLSAGLPRQADGMGGQAQHPGLQADGRLDAGQADRADGQGRHPHRGDVACLHPRPLVRRRRRRSRQDRSRMPGFRRQDAPGPSGPFRRLRAAVDDERRRDAEGDRIRLRHPQGRRHQPAEQLRRQVAGRSDVPAGAGGIEPPQGRGLCAPAGRRLLRASQRRRRSRR